MALNSTQKKFALAAIKEIKAERASYEEEMDELRKQGYGPSHCIHGTSLWVEWDPICGYCEEGVSDYQVALGRAFSRYDEVDKMLKAYVAAAKVFGDELTEPLVTAVNARITRYMTPRI